MPRSKLSDELIRKSVDFLHGYTHNEDISYDENELVNFAVNIFERKFNYYADLINKEYSREKYPEEELVIKAHNIMNEILTHKRNRTVFLNNILERQDMLIDLNAEIREVEIFFEEQKNIFDYAINLLKKMADDKRYFTADTETINNMEIIKNILVMPKPYGRLEELPYVIKKIEESYSLKLDQKKEEVRGTIIQCMGDVHTLEGYGSGLKEEIRKADNYFTAKKLEAEGMDSLTMLDMTITQLLNYKEMVCMQLETILSAKRDSDNNTKSTYSTDKRILTARRYDIFSVKRIESIEDADDYLESVRQKLYDILENNDIIQII